MRNFLIAVALSATFALASNAMAQQEDRAEFWWDGKANPLVPTGGYHFGKLGIGGGDHLLVPFVEPADKQIIDNLYVGEQSTAFENREGTVEVKNLFVTTETIGAGGAFKNTEGGTATIENFTLYVGPKETIEGHDVFVDAGAATTPIIMSDTAINAGGSTVGNTFGDWTVTNRTVQNEGTIGELTFRGGNYQGASGTVTDFILGTDIAKYENNAWGTIENLKFVDDAEIKGKITSDAAFDAGKLTGVVDSINASAVALANGIVNLNMTGISDFTGSVDFISWIDSLIGVNNQFVINFGDLLAGLGTVDASNFDYNGFMFYWSETDQFSLASLMAGDFDGEWVPVENGMGTIYEAPPAADGTVPEPATLAVLGLGLAGLGMASRRRRK